MVKFLIENVVTGFGYQKNLLSDQGMHFFNKMIAELAAEFQIQHNNMTPYHPQENGMVEAFKKILENELTKVCNVCRDDWDQKVSVLLWEYCTSCKRLKRHYPFRLLYG